MHLKFDFLMIIMPILTVFIYKNIFEQVNKYTKFDDINDELEDVLRSIIPFLITFIVCSFIIIFLIEIIFYISTLEFFDILENSPIELLSILNLIISGIIW